MRRARADVPGARTGTFAVHEGVLAAADAVVPPNGSRVDRSSMDETENSSHLSMGTVPSWSLAGLPDGSRAVIVQLASRQASILSKTSPS